MQLVTHMQSAI